MSDASFSEFTHVMDDTDLSGSMIIYFDKLELQFIDKPHVLVKEDNMNTIITQTCIHLDKKNAKKLLEELRGYLGE